MKLPKGVKLPKGHKIMPGEDITMCPFYSEKQKPKKISKANKQNLDKQLNQDNKPKREEEYYGGGGGCPFMMSGTPKFQNFQSLTYFKSQEEKSKDGAHRAII